MTRVLLILIFVLWLASVESPGAPTARSAPLDQTLNTILFLGFYVVLVLGLGFWSRWLARRIALSNLRRSLKRFGQVINWARPLVPIWFGVGVFVLGWSEVVQEILGRRVTRTMELPGLLLGTLPALLAWAGLWWSQYPADRAVREENALLSLEADLPIHAPPDFKSYFLSNLRLQVLFTIVPVLLIVIINDAAAVAYHVLRHGMMPDGAKITVSLSAAFLVFLFAPEVLRRVLHTQSLPDTPLRKRLESLCASTGLGYRDILLWRTHNNMGNAAVMGIIPRVRYVLLSDLLIETMTDEQIEAVFAHEAGHIVHHHMAWYGVFIVIFMLLSVLIGDALDPQFQKWAQHFANLDKVMGVAGFGMFWLVFGFLSRSFERQADVFAARTMEREAAATGVTVASVNPADGSTSFTVHGLADTKLHAYEQKTFVGGRGARIFASALHRVAVINNIPIGARNWTHGSIETRMHYLDHLSDDPEKTHRFDRRMLLVYGALIFALVTSASILTYQYTQ